MLTRIKQTFALAAASGVIALIPVHIAAAEVAPIQVETALEQGVLATSSAGKTVHLRIGLKGLMPAQRETRPALNVALVIDRSGSMQGARMTAARDAALMAIDRLSPRDIVSMISYDDRVEVDVPATRATDTNRIKDRIRQLTSRGSTAIWAGMKAGAEEVRKFKSRDHVNKIILLSDGIANVGPSSPEDFARLGRELAGDGITVSTVGLGNGYNEDLMAKLAINADGTHKFVAEPADLARFFDLEFNEAMGVVAQDIEIRIHCKPGVRPMRSLGRSADINGAIMTYRVNQIVGGSEQVLLAALEISSDTAVGERDLARVEIVYRGTDAGAPLRDVSTVRVRYSASDKEASASANAAVQRDVTVLTARELRQEAIRLHDAGRKDDARRKLEATTSYLKSQKTGVAGAAGYAPIEQELKASEAAASAKGQSDWSSSRKQLRELDANQAGATTKF
jgi:Ca-activated chloride channel homolog